MSVEWFCLIVLVALTYGIPNVQGEESLTADESESTILGTSLTALKFTSLEKVDSGDCSRCGLSTCCGLSHEYSMINNTNHRTTIVHCCPDNYHVCCGGTNALGHCCEKGMLCGGPLTCTDPTDPGSESSESDSGFGAGSVLKILGFITCAAMLYIAYIFGRKEHKKENSPGVSQSQQSAPSVAYNHQIQRI